MLLVEAYYTCRPGMRKELLKILTANVQGTRAEPGNISYAHYPSPENDTDMFVFEKWESVELFMSHSKTEHHQTFCRLRRPMLEPGSYQITMYDAAVDQEMTDSARAFSKENIN